MILVISGGGVKSISALGALDVAINYHTFEHVIGTSAGSIISALYCLNFTPKEMLKVLNLSKLPEIETISMSNLINNYGLSNSNDLWHTLEDIFEISEIPLNITLKETYQKSNKLLEISGYHLEKNQTCFFSHRTHPDMPLLTAVAISCNIPLLFEPIEYQGGSYIDGCIMDNFPLSRGGFNNPDVLGITLKTPNCMPQNLAEFIVYVIDSVRQGSDRCQEKFNLERCIRIVIPKDFHSLDFEINEEGIQKLWQLGESAAEKYFQEISQVDFTDKKSAKINFVP